MSLLAPLFLLGALAVAAPIVAHLVRRATRERVQFSATRFLEPSPPTVSRRRRVEHPWLLLLRTLVILVLALGFARPFFRTDHPVVPKASPPRHLVIVLDQSASMQRTGAFPEALKKMRSIAAALDPGDRFAIVGTGSSVPILAFSQWASAPPNARTAMLDATLERARPGWGPTWLDSAVDVALEEVEAMNEAAGGVSPSEIAIVSDFSAGARISGLAGREWPEEMHVTLAEFGLTDADNASLHPLGWTEVPSGARAARLQVSNHANRTRPIELRLIDTASGSDPMGNPRRETLAPGETRVVLLEIPDKAAGAFRVDLTGDAEPFDNSVWLVPPQRTDIRVGYLGTFKEDDPAHSHFYLSRALSGSRNLRPVLQAIAPGASNIPDDIALFVVAAPLSGGALEALHTRVEAGACVLVLAADDSLVATAGRLAGEKGWSTSAYARPDALLGTIDFTHPQFEVFADPRYSDFTRVRFWEPVPIALPENSVAKVVAQFEEGSPAVVEAPVGDGAVLVWGGDWQPKAGQWVLSSKFVPWVHSLLARASGGPRGPDSAEVGSAFHSQTAAHVAWEPVAEMTTAGSVMAPSPQQPGIYRVTEGAQTRLVAIQVPASESIPGSLALDAWEQLGAPLTQERARRPSGDRPAGIAQAINLENEQKLWRWLLLGAMILLSIESVVAIGLARQHTRPAQEGA